MAEYVVDHEQYLNVVPPYLRDIAVLAEPLTIAEKAVTQIFWMMQQRPPWIDPETPSEERGRGLSALVLGIGPVGLLRRGSLAARAPSPPVAVAGLAGKPQRVVVPHVQP